MINEDLISIIIVNWNGIKWLGDCFDSIYNQIYKNFEIVFVDNASTDKSVEFIKDNYPKTIIIRNQENLGFAEANNIGFKNARGNFIFLLNNDTALEPDCLEILLGELKNHPLWGAVQPKIVLMDQPNKLDSCGFYWTDFFVIYLYGFRKNSHLEKYNKVQPFLTCKGAAMLTRKEIIDKVGLFDKDFFYLIEDVDFCYKIWLIGYECWHCPKTTVYHAYSGTISLMNQSLTSFLCLKNMLLFVLTNFEAKNTLKEITVFLIKIPSATLIHFFHGRFLEYLGILFKVFRWHLTNFKSTINKRRLIQKLRQRTDKEIFAIVKKNPSPKYLWYAILNKLEDYPET